VLNGKLLICNGIIDRSKYIVGETDGESGCEDDHRDIVMSRVVEDLENTVAKEKRFDE